MSFLDYTGKYTKKKGLYTFYMAGNKQYHSKYCTKILDPTFDNSFKLMLSRKCVLKSLLNSILFPETKLIEGLEFCKVDFPGKVEINHRYGAYSKYNRPRNADWLFFKCNR